MASTILVVEDDPKSMTLTTDILRVSGFATIQAGDGSRGVELAKTTLPDLILMDIMMPKMDGYTACHEIKSDPTTRKIPVVMLTAVGYALNRKMAESVGAQGYLTKPLTRQALMDAITPLLPVQDSPPTP